MTESGRNKKEYEKPELCLEFDDLGAVLKISGYTKKGNYFEREVAEFDNISNECQILIDPLRNKETKENKTVIQIKNEVNFARTDIEVKNLLHKAKRPSSYINRTEEEYFVEEVKALEYEEVKLSNVACFDGKKYLDYPNYKFYQISYVNNNGVIDKQVEYVPPEDSYLEFIKLDPDMKKVKEVKKTLNDKVARSDLEKKFYKLILSWSISSTVKPFLKSEGINLHPILNVIGQKELGKTTACHLGISAIWNTIPLEPEHFEGSRGARIKQLMPVIFPYHIDEITSLDRWQGMLKNATITGILKIPKGRKDGGIDNIEKPFNICISCNKFKVSDPAFNDRIIKITYNHTWDKNLLTDKELVKINEDIIHLGKYIYNKLPEYNIKEILKEVIEENSQYSDRDLFKIIYIKFGEKILNKEEIFKDVIIEPEFILKKDTLEITLKDQIIDILRGITNSIIIRNKEETYSVKSVLESEFITASTYTEFSTKGIYISDNYKGIVFGKEILSILNEKLARIGSTDFYKTIKSVAEDMNKQGEYKINKIIQPNSDSGKSTKLGLKLKLGELFDD